LPEPLRIEKTLYLRMTDAPVRIFIAYAREDDPSREKLRKQLSALERRGHFHIFWDGLIQPGERWDDRLKTELHRADIFLLLVSEDFLDSDYVHEVELPKALQLRAQGKAEVLPVILRRCLWQHTELAELQCFLCEGKPVEAVTDGFAQAAEKVVEMVNHIKANRDNDKTKKKILVNVRETSENQKRVYEEAFTTLEKTLSPLYESAQKFINQAKDPFNDFMIPIKGASFDMGSEDFDYSKPVHKVTLPDFWLCKYPVTQGQWKQIMGNNPSHFTGNDMLPVEKVSWDDAQVFLQTLNSKTNGGYRLPTEVEWEYAARGGHLSKGYKYAGSNDPKEVAWYWENSGDKPLSGDWSSEKITANNCRTHPIGQKKPNELGLHDMSGNVWEWCQDVWHRDYKGAPTDSWAWEQDGDGAIHVGRGGSWNDIPDVCLAARRGGYYTDRRLNYFGLRLAR